MNHKDIVFSLTVIFSITIMFSTSDAQGSSGSMTVVVAYEALEKYSKQLFANQLTSAVLDEFSNCNIQWKFLPCSMSKVVNGHLTCYNGEPECVLDRMYACATKLNESDMKSVGKFVIAMYNGGNQIGSAQSCATASNLKNWDAIEKCSKSGDGDKYCETYWDQINNDMQILSVPGILIPPEKYNDNECDKATKKFKEYLCEKIKEKNMSCQACGGGGASGSGANGGGSGHGGHGGH